MSGEVKTLHVRVLEHRALSLYQGDLLTGSSVLYLAGDELDLPAGEAEQLIADGIVKKA